MQTTKFFNDSDSKQKAQVILKNLDRVQVDVEKYNKELHFLSEKLENTHSFPEFFDVVNDIIKSEETLDKFLLREMRALNKNVKDIIINDVKDKDEFKSFTNILNFNPIITDKILKTKERLSIDRLEKELPEEECNFAKKFINSITVLKPITQLIEKQKTHFKNLLASAESMEKINDIESQVDAQDRDFLQAYQTLINFPEDESTAGAIIKFLETNQHIKAIMESFDFAESLVDDVLNAKVRVAHNLSQSSGPNY